jgi:hypothetical protein
MFLVCYIKTNTLFLFLIYPTSQNLKNHRTIVKANYRIKDDTLIYEQFLPI